MSPEVLRLLWRFAALPVLIGLVLGVVLLIYIRSRKAKPPDFWKLASERPDHAYDWFVSHDGWVVVDFDARRHKEPKGAEVVGPFILRVPKLGGRRVAVYGRRGSMEESEATFVRFFGARPEE
jgi:hypothetical protein